MLIESLYILHYSQKDLGNFNKNKYGYEQT